MIYCVEDDMNIRELVIYTLNSTGDAALAASLFHYKELEIKEVKKYLRDEGVSVRL